MTEFGFPYRIDDTGRTAVASADRHIREMIEQILFTRKGERVNRPDFGAGLSELIFSENSPEIAAAAQHMVQGNLHMWMSNEIEIRDVSAEAQDSKLLLKVVYRRLSDASEHIVEIEREL